MLAPRMTTAAALILLVFSGGVHAQSERSAVSFLPDDLDLAVELVRPGDVWTAFRSHPLLAAGAALDPRFDFSENADLRRLERAWDLLRPFAKGPIAVGFRNRSTPRLALVLGDPEGLGAEAFLRRFARAIEKEDAPTPEGDPEDGILQLEGVGQAVAREGRILFATHPPLLRRMLRQDLDGSFAAREDWVELATEPVELRALAPDLPPLLAKADGGDPPKDLFGVLLLAPFAADLERARSARLQGRFRSGQQGLRLELVGEDPAPEDWTHSGRATSLLPSGPETLGRLQLDRDLAEFWRRRFELVPAAGRQGLAEFTQGINTFFAGIAFDEVLAGLRPGTEVIIERNAFETDVEPDLKLPAFALAFRHEMDEPMKDRFRAAFQTAIGIINADGGQKGRQPMLQATARVGEVEILAARFLPDPREGCRELRYNATPAMAFAGDRLILSSSRVLLERILRRPSAAGPTAAEDAAGGDGGYVLAEPSLELLRANRTPLQDSLRLERGLEEDEAGAALDAALAATSKLRGFSFSREREGRIARWNLSFRLDPRR
ncbi:MAG: hypothetical protein R3F20_03190 [Planctomycetota bacterium]